MKTLLWITVLITGAAVAATRGPELDAESQVPAAQGFKDLLHSGKQAQDPENLDPLEININSIQRIRQRIWNKVRICENCHTESMHTGNNYLPILQGQNREYLFKKLQTFKKDKKSYHPFPSYTQSLSEDDLADISLFYATQSSNLNKSLVRLGSTADNNASSPALSVDACLDCHGMDGNGARMIPALSGQNTNYLSYRIREIANDDSRVHRLRDEFINCSIGEVTVRQSRELAGRFGVAVDKQRVDRGKAIYQQVCASCHDNGIANAPRLDDVLAASRTLTTGVEQFTRETRRQKANAPYWDAYPSMSVNQWNDVIDYIVDQAGRNH